MILLDATVGATDFNARVINTHGTRGWVVNLGKTWRATPSLIRQGHMI